MKDLRFLQGQVAERRRMSEILLATVANGREREAIELALNTTLSAGAAMATLADLPKRHPENFVCQLYNNPRSARA